MEPYFAARIAPLSAGDPRVKPFLEAVAGGIGYEPSALMTMARKVGLVEPFLELAAVTINSPTGIDPVVRGLAVCEAARVAGSFYSAVHSVYQVHSQNGVGWEKLRELPNYQVSSHFSQPERAALAIASAGATLPVGDIAAAFEAARGILSEEEIIEVVAAIAVFSLLFHWNSIMASNLEATPAIALEHVPWLAKLRQGT